MIRQPGFRTRTPKKQNELIAQIRQRIISGVWPAGNQLPIRTELEAEFNVSAATLQRALDQLRREGFIFARGSSGTFVNPHPPHQNHYGLILPNLRTPEQDHFWDGLETAAARLEVNRPPLKMPVFRGGTHPANNPETNLLIQTVEEGRLAALIFGSSYTAYARHPALINSQVPKVCLCSGRHAIPSVKFDYEAWLVRALQMLMAKGRRRIAVVMHHSLAKLDHYCRFWLTLAKKHNITTGEHWWQGIPFGEPSVTRCLIQLLMRPTGADRPDGIIILNDNITDMVVGGLIQCGVAIGNDIDIVSHCNFPMRTAPGLPMGRLGFAIPQILDTCVELLDAQFAGEKAPDITSISPVTLEEFEASQLRPPVPFYNLPPKDERRD